MHCQRAFRLLLILPLLSLVAIATSARTSGQTLSAGKISGQELPETGPQHVPSGVSFSDPMEFRWRVGFKIRGGSQSAKNLLATIPVPVDWPEQTVSLVEENLPAEIRSATYRELNSNVRQLVVTISNLGANQLLEATVDFDVKTFRIAGPTETSGFKIPKRPEREVQEYLGVSPKISYRNAKLRNHVKELIAEQESDWDKVETLFDWVRDNIKYQGDDPSDSLTVFKKKSGGSEDLVRLFVAMCRVAKVPARMVWVEGGQYAEFHLVDESGTGHWFPCQLAGHREFGSNSQARIILQKGDNIKVPEKQERQLFCAEFLTGAGNSEPIVKFIRERAPTE